MRISDWSSDVCSSDLSGAASGVAERSGRLAAPRKKPAVGRKTATCYCDGHARRSTRYRHARLPAARCLGGRFRPRLRRLRHLPGGIGLLVSRAAGCAGAADGGDRFRDGAVDLPGGTAAYVLMTAPRALFPTGTEELEERVGT